MLSCLSCLVAAKKKKPIRSGGALLLLTASAAAFGAAHAACGKNGDDPGEATNITPDGGNSDAPPTIPSRAEVCDPSIALPSELRCTGLYSDFAAKTIAPDAREFAPAYPLWSDGATKRRFLLLPTG